jgi:hypothetical protein
MLWSDPLVIWLIHLVKYSEEFSKLSWHINSILLKNISHDCGNECYITGKCHHDIRVICQGEKGRVTLPCVAMAHSHKWCSIATVMTDICFKEIEFMCQGNLIESSEYLTRWTSQMTRWSINSLSNFELLIESYLQIADTT